jgi:predicted deacetylase
MGGVTARLIVSLSGLSDDPTGSLDLADAFATRLAARGVPLSLLLRPCGPAGVPAPDSPMISWLHRRRAAGDAVVLHGFDHSRDPSKAGQLWAVRGRRAEFAALPRHEAGLRLMAARRALTGFSLRSHVFVPPRWIASSGTVQALRDQGFRVLADETGVRLLREPDETGLILSRVLGFRGSGEPRALADDRAAVESWRSRRLVTEVTRVARRGGLVRVHVRVKDLRRPVRGDAVHTAVEAALALGATTDTYRLPGHARAA